MMQINQAQKRLGGRQFGGIVNFAARVFRRKGGKGREKNPEQAAQETLSYAASFSRDMQGRHIAVSKLIEGYENYPDCLGQKPEPAADESGNHGEAQQALAQASRESLIDAAGYNKGSGIIDLILGAFGKKHDYKAMAQVAIRGAEEPGRTAAVGKLGQLYDGDMPRPDAVSMAIEAALKAVWEKSPYPATQKDAANALGVPYTRKSDVSDTSNGKI